MKHLKRFNEASNPKLNHKLPKLIIEFLNLMKEKGFLQIDNFKLDQSKSDHNFILISDKKKPLYSIWVTMVKEIGDIKVGGGILCYYPGNYHTFAIFSSSTSEIGEKKDYERCVSEFENVIKSLKNGKKGIKGEFKFPFPDLEPRKKPKPIKVRMDLLQPETRKIFQDLMNKKYENIEIEEFDKVVNGKITVPTLETWEDHSEYPTLTFTLNEKKPWCESCGQVDYGMPVCQTFTNWCLNCIQCDNIISDVDANMIWKEAGY